MKPDEIEQALFTSLSASHFRTPSAGTLGDVDISKVEFGQLAAIGLDTNIVKQLGRDSGLLTRLRSALKANSVRLIMPAQTVIEFWNRYQTFASEDAKQLIGEVGKLKNLVGRMGGLSMAQGRLDTMQELVEDLALEIKESATKEYLDKSTLMMNLLLADAVQPMASRSKFHTVALSRQGCKVPPGFADEATKGSAGLGDFFVWCDFLMGSMSDPNPSRPEGTFLFATDDAKRDWKTGRTSHPELAYEFKRVTGNNLLIVSGVELRGIVERSLGGTDSDVPDDSEL